MKTHAYSYVQFQCELCEFIGRDDMDMKIHSGKLHGDQFDFGFCDYEATNIKTMKLETSNLPDKMQKCMTFISLFPELESEIEIRTKTKVEENL